jgi:hypothetical protein
MGLRDVRAELERSQAQGVPLLQIGLIASKYMYKIELQSAAPA